MIMYMGTGNVNDTEPRLYITTPSYDAVNVNVSAPTYTDDTLFETFNITQGSVHQVLLPPAIKMQGTSVGSKAVHITSDANVMVYAVNMGIQLTDGFMALPTDVAGQNFYTSSYIDCEFSQIGVVGTSNNTIVSITLHSSINNVTYSGLTYNGGNTFSVGINRFDTLQIEDDEDLSGTHITSDKPINVFSGSRNSTVHLVEQLVPVKAWGQMFATAPLQEQLQGGYFQIVGSEANTVVMMSGFATQTLINAGDYIHGLGAPNMFCNISADKPIQVVHMSSNYPANPTMMLIPPVVQYDVDYTFCTPIYPTSVSHWLFFLQAI